jgi:hypothetical protein
MCLLFMPTESSGNVSAAVKSFADYFLVPEASLLCAKRAVICTVGALPCKSSLRCENVFKFT